MKKIKLKVLSIGYTAAKDSNYILVLSETKGKRKLPVIIKEQEASYIALNKGSKKNHLGVYDSMFNLIEALNGKIEAINIYAFMEGRFYSNLVLENNLNEIIEVEMPIGEAISLSIKNKVPILTNESVMSLAGILINNDGTITKDQEDQNLAADFNPKTSTIEDLQTMLKNAIDKEEYEIAEQIQTTIDNLKNIKK